MRTLMKAGLLAVALSGLHVPDVAHGQDRSRETVSIERMSGEIDLLRNDNAVLKSRLASAEETLSTFSKQIGKVDDATRLDIEALRNSVAGRLERAERFGDSAQAQRAEIDDLKVLVAALGAEVAAAREQLKQIGLVGENAQAAHLAVAELSKRLSATDADVAELKGDLVVKIDASKQAILANASNALNASEAMLRTEIAAAIKTHDESTQAALAVHKLSLDTTRNELTALAQSTGAAEARASAVSQAARTDLSGALASISTLTKQMEEQQASKRELERTVDKAIKQVTPKVEEMIAARIDVAARRAVNDAVAADIKRKGYPALANAPRTDGLDAGALARLTTGEPVKPAASAMNRAPYDVVLSFSDTGTAERIKKFLIANGVSAKDERAGDGASMLMVGRFYEFDAASEHRGDINRRFGLNASIVDRGGQVY